MPTYYLYDIAWVTHRNRFITIYHGSLTGVARRITHLDKDVLRDTSIEFLLRPTKGKPSSGQARRHRKFIFHNDNENECLASFIPDRKSLF